MAVTNEDFKKVEIEIDGSGLTTKQRRVFHSVVSLMRKVADVPVPEVPEIISVSLDAEEGKITILGNGFSGDSTVEVNGEGVEAGVVNLGTIEIDSPTEPGEYVWEIVVSNEGRVSNEYEFEFQMNMNLSLKL